MGGVTEPLRVIQVGKTLPICTCKVMQSEPTPLPDPARSAAVQSINEDRFWDRCEPLIQLLDQIAADSQGLTDTVKLERLCKDLAFKLCEVLGAKSARIRAVNKAPGDLARQGSADTIQIERWVAGTDRLEVLIHFQALVSDDLRSLGTQVAGLVADSLLPLMLRSVIDRISQADADTCNQVDGGQSISERDSKLMALFVAESSRTLYFQIACEIARSVSADRVSLVRRSTKGIEAVGCSTSEHIDRRASLFRVLASTVESKNAIDRCRNELGCTQLLADKFDLDSQTAVVTVFAEWFGDVFPDQNQASELISSDRRILHQALQHASNRQLQEEQSRPLEKLRSFRSKILLGTAIVFFALLACTWIQVPFSLPSEGRILAATVETVRSPALGTIDELLVADGSAVAKGDVLVVVVDPELDLLKQNLIGNLATATARQLALSDARSSERGRADAAEIEVLKSEINGLAEQIALVQRQQEELVIRSPIDGIVEAWNASPSLLGRPVNHGQRLFEVVNYQDGWELELEVDDSQSGYFDKEMSCRFRLRSSPEIQYSVAVSEVSESASLNMMGRSVVKMNAAVPFDQSTALYRGASANARIDCGKRPLGFVLFRGFIQWWRENALFWQ